MSIGFLVGEVTSSCDETKLGEVMKSTQSCIESKARQIGTNFHICKIIDEMFANCAQLLRECLTEQEHR